MADWIAVVDDDMANLKAAGYILSKRNMKVSAMKSGTALLDFLKNNRPDLILLDVHMPEMDGFETLAKVRAQEGSMGSQEKIPVIFLTADEDEETETRALAVGAMDFIKKPFVPDVLELRVRHTVELVRLHRQLEVEVDKKVRENEQLSMHIVRALAAAIDAKDTYTNGHSDRVAKYSTMIARKAGWSESRINDINVMGLLHDVGKIGVPDAIINKPARLTDEEYNEIKKHPLMGADILSKIKEMPQLSTGARHHHERFDGTGYPDRIAGEGIPEEARIIAVADAYDAMTSNRSYRKYLPQDQVREEIVKGRGTQFDPVFADIMLELIDEDRNYELREL